MEFGRLPETQLDKIDFSLQKEPAFNKNILPGKKIAQPKVYVGCAKWGRKEWVGEIYPKGTTGRPDVAHMHPTVPKTIVRFVGNSLHSTDYAHIDEWVERIKLWLSEGLEELYFFMQMHDEAKSTELTVYLIEQLKNVILLSTILTGAKNNRTCTFHA